MDHTSGIRILDCFESAVNREKQNDFIIYQYDLIVKLSWCRLFFFLVSCQYHYWFCSDDNFYLQEIWPGLKKSNRPLSKFRLISKNWSELGIANLAQVSLMGLY